MKKAILMMALEAALRRAAKVQPLGEPLDWMENVRPVRWRFGDEVRTYQWE
jgi:alpha-galactosidase